jgi:hypothetical protein
VIHGDGADHLAANQQGTNQGGPKLEVGRWDTGRVELRSGQPVDQRPAVARYPPAQPVTVRDRRILEKIGMQTGREPADQVLVVPPSHEQRARGEGHERIELAADERHHLAEAHASPH